jgi:hypothetical protein
MHYGRLSRSNDLFFIEDRMSPSSSKLRNSIESGHFGFAG